MTVVGIALFVLFLLIVGVVGRRWFVPPVSPLGRNERERRERFVNAFRDREEVERRERSE